MQPGKWQRLLLALGLLLPMVALATEVRAFLDRDTVQLGQTVTLNVSVTGSASAAEPDFSVLQPDFVIKGTSRSRNVRIDNGGLQSSVLFAVALEPRRAGTLTIPPLSVDGQHSSALTLTVLAASAQPSSGPGDPVFVDADIEPHSVYVGQQARLRVRLYYRGGQIQGRLEDPQAAGIKVEKLGQQNQYRATRGGQSYQVLERDYAVTAQAPGAVRIPPVGFQGSLGAGPAGFGGLFGSAQDIQTQSGALALEVRARPAASGKGVWLPARTLTLQAEGLPSDGRATVGVPITLTLTVRATGLGASALPELTLPAIEGADVYPDQPQRQTDTTPPWLKGTVRRKFAIVPTRPGTLHVPAIALDWWDVLADHAATASLAAHAITVAPAPSGAADHATPGAPGVAGHPAQAASVPVAAAPAAGQVETAVPTEDYPWRWIALAAALLWLLTVLGWAGSRWRRRRGAAAPPPVNHAAGAARRAFREANTTPAQARALLLWARAERPQIRDFGGLGALLDDDAQCRLLEQLDRARYAPEGAAPAIAEVRKAFIGGFAWRRSDKARRGPLPPLYP